MKIKIKREGGFIGMTSKADLDYKDLTQAEQKVLDLLAQKALPAADDKTAGAPDALSKLRNSGKLNTRAIPSAPPSDNQSRSLDDALPIAQTTNADKQIHEGILPDLANCGDSPEPDIVSAPPPKAQNSASNGMMRDGFSYSISMKKDGKTIAVKFDDMTAPPEVVELFQKYVQY